MRKLSPSGGIKTVIHAPGFYDFASQSLFHTRCRATSCILKNSFYLQFQSADTVQRSFFVFSPAPPHNILAVFLSLFVRFT